MSLKTELPFGIDPRICYRVDWNEKMPASEQRKERRAEQRKIDYSVASGAEPHLADQTSPDISDVLAQYNSMNEYISTWTDELYSLALTRRRWDNLPNGVSARYLEKLLVLYGAAVIYNDGEVNGMKHYAAQSVALSKAFDEQEEWPAVRGMGANGKQSRLLTPADSVIIYDNIARIPITSRIHRWARDLARIDLERSRNIAMQNSYSLLLVDKADIKDAQRILKNSNSGIFGQLAVASESGPGAPIITPQTIQTGVQPIMDKLTASLSAKLNEIYCQLGIDYVPHEKNERLVESEATIGADVVDRHRYYYLMEAKRAADDMNRIFGGDTSVSWNGGERNNGFETDSQMA